MSKNPSAKQKNLNAGYFLNAGIAVAIMIFFRFIPPFGSMTPLGMTIMGIFLGTLWGWIKCDMVWPSVLAFIFLGFTDYTTSVGTIMTAAFSNGIVQLILWLLVFAAILTVSGISEYLANRLVSSKAIKGRPWLLTIVILSASYICSAFGAAFAGILICWEFVYMISKQVGYTKEDKWVKMMMVSIPFSSCVGLVVLPFQVGVVASYGYLSSASNGLFGAYNFLQYLIFSLIFSLVVMAVYLLLCKFIVRPDMSKLKADVDVGASAKMTTKHKLALWAMVAMIVLTMLPSIFPKGSSIAVFFNTIGTSAFVLLICAGITLFRDKEGKPYFTFQELGAKGVFWGLMFMVATAITVGTALSSPDTGFSATFVSMFTSVLGNTSPYVFALIIALVTLLLTNVINNAVAGAIMVPLMYSFSSVVGANPMMIVALIIFTSNIGLILPCASPSGALLAGNKEWISAKDIASQVLVALLAMALSIAIIGIPLGNLVFS